MRTAVQNQLIRSEQAALLRLHLSSAKLDLAGALVQVDRLGLPREEVAALLELVVAVERATAAEPVDVATSAPRATQPVAEA